ncbi:type II toxin-antitoxin system Phd/YefM family antitoxin [Mycobacterium sp.]|uniref:type II toxin-antitoxin system Phd/YefM family antitoxin n=1 Tax=Mycobacterium sp. TaxID=1785 RepID=UPI00126E89F1|nr:type II toxin-antitoxin system prevent-host-death family antitoxin [Mycobacterium sp.]KAA8970399.1 MAG: type II toxin-antitoxin system prevent-host-death family antitoxin [Mycobacterium sp.]
MEIIGVRELRQNASRYLARVRSGEVVGVTQRGRLVARLVPVTTDRWADLVASGEVLPARTSHEDVLANPPRDYGFSGSEELQRLRRDER